MTGSQPAMKLDKDGMQAGKPTVLIMQFKLVRRRE